MFKWRMSSSFIELDRIIKQKYNEDDYVKGRFSTVVKHYDYYSSLDSLWYNTFQRVVLVTSALTPFILGLEAIVSAANNQTSVIVITFLKIGALLTSLIVAIFGSYLVMFNLEAKWIKYTLIRNSLIAEFYLYDNGIKPYLPLEGKEKDKKLFVANAEKKIRDADMDWAALRDSKVAKDQNSISVYNGPNISDSGIR